MRDDLARARDPLEKLFAQTTPDRSWRPAPVDGFHTFVFGLKVLLELVEAV